MLPEVLAPAGSMESLIAAVRSGADAVYVGSNKFSARRNAQNFNDEELSSAAEYCRIRGVKLYLTLNIMLKNSELGEALALVDLAEKLGINGIIVQDLGIARLIKQNYPEMEIHASTQMNIHEKSALPYLKSAGIKRVVISREMSREDIADFCTAAAAFGIEVEVFVHGALCMCVSGQCLLSSVLGSRSGNRGLCAGPCRLPFAAEGGTGHDLSLKDSCLLEEIAELGRMGVSSLKIEGRMKRPEYVAAATFAARKAVDNGRVEIADIERLRDVFSRSGFTKGYYEDKLGRDMFGIRTADDALSSAEVITSIHEIYRLERQCVPLDINVTVKSGEPICLFMSDGTHTVSTEGSVPQKAIKRESDEDYIKSAVTKLGGTPYKCESFNIKTEGGLFIPLSELNALRRDAVEKLDKQRAEVCHHGTASRNVPVTDDALHENKGIIARFRSQMSVPEDIDKYNVFAICLPCECDFTALPQNIEKIADTPRYIKDGKKLETRLKELKSSGVKYALCGSIQAAGIANRAGMSVIGDMGLNIANDISAECARDIGAEMITVSPELTLKEVQRLKTPLEKVIFAYGRLPLMLTKNCPLKNGRKCSRCDGKGVLRDRKGIEFPVNCRMGYSELFNSSVTYLADRLDEINGVDYLMLYFTDEDETYVKKIINDYISGGEPPKKYTRGLYYKGVL